MIEQTVFIQFLSLVESLSGMAPPVSHQNHIRREIPKLQSRWNMDAQELLNAIRYREEVRQDFLNCVTINETYFFREQRHFDFLRTTVLPQLSDLDRMAQFWSVSCSTGEEAVSLAVLAAEYRTSNTKNLKKGFIIHASDINARVLEQFRSGRFSLRSFRSDGSAYHEILRSYGTQNGDLVSGSFVLDPGLKKTIHIFGMNVWDQEIPGEKDSNPPEMVDVIFFRNTLLYMGMEKRPRIMNNLVRRMSPGGWLFLSSSEVPFVEHKELEIVEHQGVYCFRKRQASVPCPPSTGPRIIQPPADPAVLPPLVQAPQPPPQDLNRTHEEITKVLDFIHTGQLEEAEKNLEVLCDTRLEEYIEGFLLGQLYRAQNMEAAAAVQFARSFDTNPGFWPGRFYYALCIKDRIPQSALAEFRTLVGRIGAAERDNLRYDFLLDGFDSGLFKQIAQDWVRRLEAAGTGR